MTLIVKELIIRGIVTGDSKQESNNLIDKRELAKQMEELQKQWKKDFVNEVFEKLESKNKR